MNTLPPMQRHQNLDDFEAFYSMLDDSHAGLDPARRRILDRQVVLLLANQIGDMAVLREVFALARVKLDMIRPASENADASRPG
jgi:hypothetical protein